MDESRAKHGFYYPTQEDIELAKKSSEKLTSFKDKLQKSLQNKKHNAVNFTIASIKQPIDLPESVFNLLLEILEQTAQGNAVSILPHDEELTTQEAADLLNVSRPYLVKLLENNDIPHRKVGTKRRILAKDIFAYKSEIDNKRLKVLNELAEEAQKLNLGYGEDD